MSIMLNPFQFPFKQVFGFGEDEEKENSEQEFKDDEDCDENIDLDQIPDYDAIDDDAIASMEPGYEKHRRNSSFTDDYLAADDKALKGDDESDDCYCGHCNIGAHF